MIWNDPEARSAQEVRDLKDERDSEAYQAMYAQVEAEMTEASFGWGYGSPKPEGRKIHNETIRRLREQTE